MNSVIIEGLDRFFSRYSFIHLDKGATLLVAFETPQGIYFLKKGFIREFMTSKNGRELTVHIFEPGAFFPLNWAVNGVKNQYFFEALTEADLNFASKNKVLTFLNKNPQVLSDLVSRLLSAISGLSRRIESQTFDNAYQRVISSLLYLTVHFGIKNGPGVLVREHFTHEDIAKLTGITRERTSLQMEKLEKNGLLNYQSNHSLVIPNLIALEKELT